MKDWGCRLPPPPPYWRGVVVRGVAERGQEGGKMWSRGICGGMGGVGGEGRLCVL
jgi:hypothetical protein